MSNSLRSESFHLVGEQVAATLADAHKALESFAEGDAGTDGLDKCAEHLHSAYGALQITEIYGAGLLAEEMEHTCGFLAQGEHSEQTMNEGIEALSRAIVQLPAYVERIMGGGRDIPLVLLPLLNDLRAARGKPLLSESTLLLLNVGGPATGGAAERPAPSGEDLAALVRKVRPQFQLGLLGFIKGGDQQENLRRMAAVAAALERAAVSNEVHQLWWVVGGVLEAIAAGGLEPSVALKRLIGQADREIKRLQEEGEDGVIANPPTDLVNNLLYYIARTQEGGPRCEAIRAAFNLSGLGPGDEQIEQLREQLSAPSARLMKTVADAIREDLGKAKDVLDIFVRTGMQDRGELAAQVELLRKISDTLGVLGLGQLREIVQQRSAELASIAADDGVPEEAQLVALAAALLEVETRLDSELVEQVRAAGADPDADTGAQPDDEEFRQVAGAVLRECMVNLAHIKESITQVLAQPGDAFELDALDEQIRGISAGLMMLGKTRAVDLLNRLAGAIRSCVVANPGAADAASLNRLADSIVSLEYYMETLQAGRKEPVYMLDNADRSLQAIEADHPFEPPVEEAPAVHTATLRIDTEQLAALPDLPEQEQAETDHAGAEDESEAVDAVADPGELARTAVIDAPVLATGEQQPDPELLELFIEEAREEIAAISRHFPAWADNQRDEEALITVRRSFHTLKGSGRMVGAAQIGEYSWNIENLLNKLISKTVEVTGPMLAFLADAVEALPQLLEQLEAGTEPTADLPAIAADAACFAEGVLPGRYAAVRGALAEVPDEPADDAELLAPEQLESVPAEAEPQGIDPVLLDILSRETAGHIGAVRAFLDECAASAEAFPVSEEMQRACHTLHGSVTMADAGDMAVLTGPLYQMIEPLYRQAAPLSAEQRQLCGDTLVAIETVLAHLLDPDTPVPNTLDIEARLQAAADAVGGEELQTEEVQADDDMSAELPRLQIPSVAEQETEAVAPADELTTAAEEPAAPEETAPAVELPRPVEELIVPDSDFDPEIAAIFAEEATEILEAADAALGMLAQNSSNIAPLEELQRHLHTLKGGARMAGITTMGDFSHDLESLLIRINSGTEAIDEQKLGLLQSSIDELHRMRDQVPGGSVAPPSAALLARFGVEDEPVEHETVEQAPVEQETVEEEVAATEAAETPAEDEPAELAERGAPAVPEPEKLGELARELTSGARPESPSGELPGELVPAPAATADAAPRREMARVDSQMLEDLLNNAGEISIAHSRMNQQVSSMRFNLEELGQTVRRLQAQLRNLEIETEAQILHRHQAESDNQEEFDPLELDRYSTIQQLSRALAETANDVSSIRDLLQNIVGDAESILLQQSRTTSELQDSLMRTRMVPFDQMVPRLSRLVRQQAQESGKQVELQVEGSSGELDRQVMEKMLPPFEHMLRNAIIHGIEAPEERIAAGKPIEAKITIRFERDGSQVLIRIMDDGAGLNLDSVRAKALEQGLIKPDDKLTDEETAQLILRSGLSTADKLTQSAGRGVGMDVVSSEVSKLGGTLSISTEQGAGCTFTVRLPYTLAITQAFIVKVGNEVFALPLPSVEGVLRLSGAEFSEKMAQEDPFVEYSGRRYQLRPLGSYLGMGATRISGDADFVSIILVSAGENSTALITDEAAETREIVVKPISPLFAGIGGIAGATILGDGRVVIILDAPAIVRAPLRSSQEQEDAPVEMGEDLPPLALVVDDSITMRRVTQRLLERNGMRVITAKDGVEAVETLQDHKPEIIILDVEMPRMDGYEFATHVRNTQSSAEIPIIMVTSRTGEKHRARAIEIGVNDYLGKPYQEHEMLEAIRSLLGDGFNKPRKVATPENADRPVH